MFSSDFQPIARDVLNIYKQVLALANSWEDYLSVSVLPVHEKVSLELAETDLEQALADKYVHLGRIVLKPRVELHTEEEVRLASQTRRIVPRTIQHLIQNTANWQSRRRNEIIPRRLLTVRYEEHLLIYENRVLARLLDRLGLYLSHRLQRLHDLEKAFRGDDDTNLTDREEKQRTRLSLLLKSGMQLQISERQHLEQCLSSLEALKARVSQLQHSAFSQAIPQSEKQNLPLTLKMTNIFRHDGHYRHVAQLWNLLEQSLNQERQEVSDEGAGQFKLAFFRYGLLLTVKALEQSGAWRGKHQGYSLIQGGNLTPGDTIVLGHPSHVPLRLTVREDSIVIDSATHCGERRLILVPVFEDLSGIGLESFIERYLTQNPTLKARQPNHKYVLLAPATASQLQQRSKQEQRRLLSSELDPSRPHPFEILPVSPVDLDSVERLNRIISNWLWQSLALELAKKSFIVPQALKRLQFVMPEWMKANNDRLHLQGRIKLEVIGQLQKQLSSLLTEQSLLARERQDIESLIQTLASNVGLLSLIATCPVCFETQSEITLRNSGKHTTFHMECLTAKCRNVWESRECKNCHQVYPVIIQNIAKVSSLKHLMIFAGRQLWSLPCENGTDGKSFICPFCGACTSQSINQNACDHFRPISSH